MTVDPLSLDPTSAAIAPTPRGAEDRKSVV